MKFLESKYYKPLQNIELEYLGEQRVMQAKDFIDEVKHKNNPYECLLDRLLANIYLGNDEMVIHREDLKDFQKCTDFHTVAYHAKKNMFYAQEACYFHPEYQIFILTNEDLATDYDKFIFESGLLRVMQVHYDSSDSNAINNVQQLFTRYLHKYVSSEARISILVKQGQDLEFKHHTIKPYKINLNTMYNENFLSVHQKIQDELTNGSKGVVLLHGIAGSGKTNYIKWLTSQIPEKDFIFVANNMIHLLVDPAFINLLLNKKNSVIVLEDCENYIAERSIDNSNSDVVASILNIADGMLSDILECQFICTFNANLTEIDHALLRRGRLIAEYYFDELSVERCNAYLESVDKDIRVDRTYSLAELTHIDEQEYKAEKKQKSKLGFV